MESQGLFKQGLKVEVELNDGIFSVGGKGSTASLVEEFYTTSPFPNYDDFESIYDLHLKVTANPFTKALKEHLGLGKSFVEVGSGTSQLSIALAFGTNNRVVALDTTLQSLSLGHQFAMNHGIDNCTFVHSDIFNDPFEKETFDMVFCSGVLHHTQDPLGAFNIISKWLKPGGTIVLGLYNAVGRRRTILRRFLFNSLGAGKMARNLVSQMDPVIRELDSSNKINAWFQDQYQHPVESTHRLGEILKWFLDSDIEYLSSIPAADASEIDISKLFVRNGVGNPLTRFVSELSMISNNSGKEGGLFITIGRKAN